MATRTDSNAIKNQTRKKRGWPKFGADSAQCEKRGISLNISAYNTKCPSSRTIKGRKGGRRSQTHPAIEPPLKPPHTHILNPTTSQLWILIPHTVTNALKEDCMTMLSDSS